MNFKQRIHSLIQTCRESVQLLGRWADMLGSIASGVTERIARSR